MSIWGKIGGAAAGFALGGPLGALIGGLAGHFAVDREGRSSADEKDPTEQIAFTVGVIALGAKMAKADGVVTKDEVDAFREIFHVPPREVENVRKVFDLARQDVAGYESYARQIAKLFAEKPAVLEDLLDGLFHIAKADHVVHPKELEFLENVAAIFGFDETGFARVKARHMEPDAADPYTVLGVDPGIDNEGLKAAYRKLVRDNHPDAVMARGVPEEFVALANERLAAVNAAYDRLKQARGIG